VKIAGHYRICSLNGKPAESDSTAPDSALSPMPSSEPGKNPLDHGSDSAKQDSRNVEKTLDNPCRQAVKRLC
ncbi:MAG: hypothetical protein KZQ73_04490, partial [Candidatus Thiodiazotropha sp. (ex Semelilucina semeliformis)]|nr:hypothetical protein [Candidatus Thiodiazotropha sp. (ex Semelilucina semeliformis)]